MKLERVADVFFDISDSPPRSFNAEEVVQLSEEIQAIYPHIEVTPSYWDIGFEYIYIDSEHKEIGLKIQLNNRRRSYTFTPPSALEIDYFIFDNVVMPLRKHDFEMLSKFLPTLEKDGLPGMNIQEISNFEIFASRNRFAITNAEIKDEYLANPHFDISKLQSNLAVTPYPYQAVGIEWLWSQQVLQRPGAMLCDVMGLGKTLQAIGLITKNVASGRLNNLVITRGTLIENWRREIIKFSPKLNVLVHAGAFRAGTAGKVVDYDVVITSYDALIRDYSMLRAIPWNIVAVDEAQDIKNPRAQRSIRAKSLPREFGLVITGTPLENRLLDLWSLSEFADPSLFGSETMFENEYEGVQNGAQEVNRVIRPVLLRRKLDDIEHQLPDKIVIDHALTWPEELNEIYENVRTEALREFAVAGGLVATGRLRKLTTHPVLMEIGPNNLEVLSPKYQVTLAILDELFANNEKCLIFASYSEMIDRMKGALAERFPLSFIESLDGRTEMGSRTTLIDAFNSFSGSGVLICNPLVAGAGLNITGANHVIHYNLEWNPAKEDQATFRVYRHGQLKTSFIHRLFYVDTIDEIIDQRIQMKRELADLSVDAKLSAEDYLAGLNISPIGRHHD
jgi:SNF2 family DNA or RNA helicase